MIVSRPGNIPVTTPPVVIVALPLLLPHAPPPAVSVKVISEPAHTPDGPLIVPVTAVALTVTVFVATAVPQPVVTV